MPLSFWLDIFLDSRAEIHQIFVSFFCKMKTPKIHSDINWPLEVLAFRKAGLLLSLKKTRAPKFLQGTMKWKDYVTHTFIYALARLLTWKYNFFWSPNWIHWKVWPITSFVIQKTVGLVRKCAVILIIRIETVFCFKYCSDLMWENCSSDQEKHLQVSAKKLQKFWDH